MKALIRNTGEDVLEKDFGVLGIDEEMILRMCSETWAGGPYTIIDDYVEPDVAVDVGDEPEPAQIITAVESVAEVPKIYHINGRDYSEDELRAMLNQ